jgi:phage tail-like protein
MSMKYKIRGAFDRLLVLALCTGFFLILLAVPVGAQNRDNPLDANLFALELDGVLNGYFTSVTGIGSESEVVEHKVVDDKTGQTIVRKLPGRLDWMEVTFHRGLTTSMNIWQWRQQVVAGNIQDARKNASVVALNRSNQVVARWELFNAWPQKIIAQIGDQGQIIEKLILVSEGVVREEVDVPDVCTQDYDGDSDADGKDLSRLIADFKPDCLAPFAAVFGKVALK